MFCFKYRTTLSASYVYISFLLVCLLHFCSFLAIVAGHAHSYIHTYIQIHFRIAPNCVELCFMVIRLTHLWQSRGQCGTFATPTVIRWLSTTISIACFHLITSFFLKVFIKSTVTYFRPRYLFGSSHLVSSLL